MPGTVAVDRAGHVMSAPAYQLVEPATWGQGISVGLIR
jgi:hypothetical protein